MPTSHSSSPSKRVCAGHPAGGQLDTGWFTQAPSLWLRNQFFFRLFYKLIRFKPVFSSRHLSGRAQLPSKAGSCNQGVQESAQEGVFYGETDFLHPSAEKHLLWYVCSPLELNIWGCVSGGQGSAGFMVGLDDLGVFYNLNDSMIQSAAKRAK